MATDWAALVDKQLGNTKPTKEQEVAAGSKVAEENLASVAPVSNIIARDSAGNVTGSGKTTDADTTLGNRLAYADGTAKTYDAWETYHEDMDYNEPSTVKKMEKQRRALSEFTGIPYEEVTNNDVFTMGADSQARKAAYLKASNPNKGSTLEVTSNELLGKDESNNYGRGFSAEKTMDNHSTLDKFNTPLDNADFYSKYNAVGRENYEKGNTEKQGNEAVSARDANTTFLGGVYNNLLGVQAMGRDLAAGTVNTGLDATGDVNVKPEDLDYVDSIREKRKQATINAKNEADIQKAKAAYIKKNPNAKDADEKFKSLGFSTDKYKNIEYTPEEQAFLKKDLTGKDYFAAAKDTPAGNFIDSAIRSVVPESMLNSQKPKTFTGEEAIARKDAEEARRSSVTSALESNSEGSLRTKVVGGKTSLVGLDESTSFVRDQASKTIAPLVNKAAKDWDEGNYMSAVGAIAQGGFKHLVEHPQATVEHVARSVPDMVFNVTTGGTGLVIQSNRSFNTQLDQFKQVQGRNPTSEEASVMTALGMAKALSDKGVDHLFVGGALTKGGKQLSEMLVKAGVPKSASAKVVSSLALGSTAEGAQEGYTQYMELVGAYQNSGKKMPMAGVIEAAMIGMASGAAMQGGMDAKSTITAPLKDSASLVAATTRGLGAGAEALINRRAVKATENEVKSSAPISDKGSLAGAIAQVESGKKGYNAYNRGTARQAKEDVNFSDYTLGEVMANQANKNANTRWFAVGKYQVIPKTMIAAVEALGLDKNQKFTPELQEIIFTDYLASKKRPPMYNYITGKHDNIKDAQTAMAQEWASVAKDDGGQSYYAGSAGNAAHMTSAQAKSFLNGARTAYAAAIANGVDPKIAYRTALGSRVTGSAATDGSATTDGSVDGTTTTAVDEPIRINPVDMTIENKISLDDIEDVDTIPPTTYSNPTNLDEVASNQAYQAALAVELEGKSAKEVQENPELARKQQEMDSAPEQEMTMEQLMAMMDDMASSLSASGSGSDVKVASAVLSSNIEPTPMQMSKLSEGARQLVTQLQDFNKNLGITYQNGKKTFSGVQAEKLGTTMTNNKAGLGKHVQNAVALVANNNKPEAKKAIRGLLKFREDQQAKITALEDMITNDLPEVKLANGFKFSNESKGKSQGFVNQLKDELKLMDKGVGIATNVYNTQFFQKAEVTKEATKSETAKAPKSEEAVKETTKPKEATAKTIIEEAPTPEAAKAVETAQKPVEDLTANELINTPPPAAKASEAKQEAPVAKTKETAKESKPVEETKAVTDSKPVELSTKSKAAVNRTGSVSDSDIKRPSRPAQNNEVPTEIVNSGSLSAILGHISTATVRPFTRTMTTLLQALTAKNDVKVISEVDGKPVVREFTLYQENVIGIKPNIVGLDGTDMSTILHETSHIFLNDYLLGTARNKQQETLQKEYARIHTAFVAAVAKRGKGNKALKYATDATELYAMALNNRTVNTFLENTVDTGSVAKGFTLLDSLLSLAVDVFNKLAGKVSLKDSLEALTVASLQEMAGELQEGNLYMQSLETDASTLPSEVYHALLQDPANVNKDGTLKVAVLKMLGVDPSLRTQVHKEMFPHTKTNTKKPTDEVKTSQLAMVFDEAVEEVKTSKPEPKRKAVKKSKVVEDTPVVEETQTTEVDNSTTAVEQTSNPTPVISDEVKAEVATAVEGINKDETIAEYVARTPEVPSAKKERKITSVTFNPEVSEEVLAAHEDLNDKVLQAAQPFLRNHPKFRNVTTEQFTDFVLGMLHTFSDVPTAQVKQSIISVVTRNGSLKSGFKDVISKYAELVSVLEAKPSKYDEVLPVVEEVNIDRVTDIKNLDTNYEVKDRKVIDILTSETVTGFAVGSILSEAANFTFENTTQGKDSLEAKLKLPEEVLGLISEEPTSIFSTVPNVLIHNDQVEELLTPEEIDTYKSVQKILNSFSNALDKGLPNFFHRPKKMYRTVGVRQPLAMFVNDNNVLPTNVKQAMGVAVLDWFKLYGQGTANLTAQDLSMLSGIDEAMIDNKTLRILQTSGIPASSVSASIGKTVLKMLNMKVNYAEADGMWGDRLAQYIGDTAILAFSQIPGSPIEISHINSSMYAHAGLKLDVTKSKEGSAKSVMTIRINNPIVEDRAARNADGTLSLPAPTERLLSLLGSENYANLESKLFSAESAESKLHTTPVTQVVSTYDGTVSKLPENVKQAVKAFQSEKLIPNEIHKVFKAMDRESWLTMHGWTHPKLIDKMTDFSRIIAEGKNVTLESEYLSMKTHDVRMDAEISRMKDGKAKTELAASRGFYLPFKVSVFGRIFDSSRLISWQRSKMHRNAFSAEALNQEIETNNADHIAAVMYSYIEPFGIPKHLDPAALKAFFHTYVMDREGNIIDDVTRKGAEAIMNARTGEEFSSTDIINAVKKLKEKGHSLGALSNLATWSEAIKEDLPTWNFDSYTEVDGTTNGVKATLRQLQTGMLGNAMQQQQVRELANAGGIFLEGDTYVDGMDYVREGNKDDYQGVGIKAAKTSEKSLEMGSTAPVSDIYKAIQTFKGIRRQMARNGSGDMGRYGEIKAYLEQHSPATMTKLLKNIIPSYVTYSEDGTASINSDGRNAAKPTVMTGNYLAGETSQIRALFKTNVLIPLYKAVETNNTAYLKELASIFQQLGINEKFSKIDGKKEMHPIAEQALYDAYAYGYGAAMTEAFKAHIGSPIDNGSDVIGAFSLVSTVMSHIINKAVADAEKAKGNKLSSDELAALKFKLQEQGIYVGLQSALTTGDSSALVIENTIKQLVPKELGGEVQVQGWKVPYTSTEVSYDGMTDSIVKVKNNTLTNRNSKLTTEVVDMLTGVKAVLGGIIGIDAATQVAGAVNDARSFLNVYDAKIMNVLQAVNQSIGTNQDWDDVNKGWGLAEAVLNRFNDTLTLLSNMDAKEVDSILKPLVFHQKYPIIKDRKLRNELITKGGYPLIIKELQATFGESLRTIMEAKKVFDDKVIGIAQYRIDNGTYRVPGKTTETTTTTEEAPVISNNFVGDVNVELLQELIARPATTTDVMDLFLGLEGSSKNHDEHLEKLMGTTVAKFMKAAINFKIDAGFIADKPSTSNAYVPFDFDIHNLGYPVSSKEYFATEMVSNVIGAGIKASTATLHSFNEAHKHVKANIDRASLTPEMYDYLFNHPEGVRNLAVMSLTNEAVMNAVEAVPEMERSATVLQFISNSFDNLIAKFIPALKIRHGSTTVSNLITELANNTYDARTNAIRTAWEAIKASKYGDKVDGVLHNNVKPAIDKYGSKLGLKNPSNFVTEQGQKALTEMAEEINRHDIPSEVHGIVNELKGVTRFTKNYHDFLRRSNQHVESAAMSVANATRALLVQEYGDISKHEYTSLGIGLLKTEAYLLGNDTLAKADSTETRKQMIKDIARKLPSEVRMAALKDARNLGTFMATGIAPKGTLPNSTVIAQKHSVDKKAIDSLKALYALEATPSEHVDAVIKLATDHDLSLIGNMHEVNKQEYIEKFLNGDASAYVDGTTQGIQQDFSEYSIQKTETTNSNLKEVENLGNGYSVFKAKQVKHTAYQKGAVTLAKPKNEGLVIDSPVEGAIAIYRNGVPAGYKLYMPTEIKQKFTSFNAMEVVAQNTAHSLKIVEGTKYNEELVGLLAEDFKLNGNKDRKAFISLSAESTNAQVREFMEVAPKDFKQMLEKQFVNGNGYMRKDSLNLLIGYHKYSAANHLGTATKLPKDAVAALKTAEDVWTLAVGEVKRRVVLLTPAVIIANQVSNTVLSIVSGMNPIDVIKYQKEGLVSIKAYEGWRSEAKVLEAKMRVKPLTTEETAKAKELDYLIKNSNIHKLIEDGVFSLIVDDVDLGESKGFVSSIVERVAGNKDNIVSKKVEDAVGKRSAATAFKIVDYATLNSKTKLGKNVELATAYADFIARYAMYQHLQNNGMSHDDAVKDIMELFVDYAPNQSKGIQYANDIGALMYTKFWLRIQKVILKQLRTNPKANLVLFMAQQMLGDVPDITSSSLATGININTADMSILHELPLFHFLSGLTN